MTTLFALWRRCMVGVLNSPFRGNAIKLKETHRVLCIGHYVAGVVSSRGFYSLCDQGECGSQSARASAFPVEGGPSSVRTPPS